MWTRLVRTWWRVGTRPMSVGLQRQGQTGLRPCLPSEAQEGTTSKLKLVLAVGALGPHLIQDIASELPRGTTRSMHWSFSGSPQPVLKHPVPGGWLSGLSEAAGQCRTFHEGKQSRAAPFNLTVRRETDRLGPLVGGGMSPMWRLVPECPHLAGSAGRS